MPVFPYNNKFDGLEFFRLRTVVSSWQESNFFPRISLFIFFEPQLHEKVSGKNNEELAAAINRLHEVQNIGFFLMDTPVETLVAVTEATINKPLLLFNVSESADELRGIQCKPHLMHTIPSYAMLADGLAQYLLTKRWKNILLLRGVLSSDNALAKAFSRSAKKFGLKITAEKEFILSNNPRQRDRNNITLLTTHKSDVVLLVDTDGEFGRYVPFQTVHPRPIVGTEGLVASAWHWAWERHGAPQLNQRFVKRILDGRKPL